MKLNYYVIGTQIRKVRKSKQMTQFELSEAIDMSPTYLSCVENGYKTLSLEKIVCIANVLEVSLDVLMANNIHNSVGTVKAEFDELLDDCTEYERYILLQNAAALKCILRENRHMRNKLQR